MNSTYYHINTNGQTLLDALENNLALARRMLEEGFDVNGINHDAPPLHFAANIGNLQAVQLVLQYEPDVNLKFSEKQWTALHCAISAENYDIFKLLLEKGANCNERNTWGATPFHRVLRNNNMQVVQLFMNHGADIKVTDIHGRTALHYAALNINNIDVIQFVLEQGFDIECSDHHGYSPLHYAATIGNAGGCEFLLEHGAMVNKKNMQTEHTPLSGVVYSSYKLQDDLTRMRYVRVLQKILEFGANVSHKIQHESILEIAADEQINQLIRDTLIQHMAKLTSLELSVDQYDLQTIENHDCYKVYYQRCLQEFQFMKRTRFYNNVTIFNVLMNSEKVISGFARNEELLEALEEGDYGAQLPIYFSSLKKRFYTRVEKHRSRNLAAQIVSKIFKFNNPLNLVNCKILSFLSDGDLKFLEM